MAFVAANLERVAGGKQKYFLYNAGADTLATVVAAGYFNSQADVIDPGDFIIVLTSNNTISARIFVTSARGVTPVTVLNA